MAEINEKQTLELERQRATLRAILISKGIEVPEDATMGELIPLVSNLPEEDFFVNFAKNRNVTLVDNRLDSLKSYLCYDNKLLTAVRCDNAITAGSNCFEKCTALSDVSLKKLQSIGNSGFNGCTSLINIYLPECTSIGAACFTGCTNIEQVIMPNASSMSSSGLSSLQKIRLYDASAIDTQVNSPFLETLILRKSSVISISSYSKIKNGNTEELTIYVPRDLLSSYIQNTQWSHFEDCFEQLEGSDYESPTWYED